MAGGDEVCREAEGDMAGTSGSPGPSGATPQCFLVPRRVCARVVCCHLQRLSAVRQHSGPGS